MNIKRIINYLPSYPRYKMNVFSGTNTLDEVKNILKRLIFTKDIVNSKDIQKYESIISQTIKSKNIYTFSSGRMGFYTILKAIDIQKDDEIIIPSFTCIVVPNAILYSGAKPIYCDIKDNDFNIDISKIEQLITSKTKVLYAQHTFGQMCDIKAIKQIAEKYNLLVVEDTALALGAKLENKYAGTIGDFGYFSTDRSKVINTGLGGIVSVNNQTYLKSFDEIYSDIPYLSDSMAKKIAKTFILNVITMNPYFYWFGKFLNAVLSKLKLMTYFLDESFIKKDEISSYSYPARFSSLLAKIGISQFESLNANLDNRKKIANYYNEILNIYTKEYMERDTNIFLRYSFLVKNRDYWEDRFSSKIDLSIWFKTVTSGRNDNFEEINYKLGTNKISEYVCEHIFNLPTHNQIRPEKLKKLLSELKNSGDIITKENIFMKVLLLAGGFGTRLSEETDIRPKPMVEIGGRPILWHIMKIYSKYGFNDFVVLLGYKGYYIKEYFANYFLHQSDITIDMSNGQMEILNNSSEPWKVTLLDTGIDSMTGGRIKRAQDFIGDEPFMLTYGDGVSDINIEELVKFHKSHGKAMTMTSAQPDGRFGALDISNDNQVLEFKEKPKGDGSWINAGFFVCEPKVFDYILDGDSTVFEQAPLMNLAKDGEIFTYKHDGFWMPMDTLRDKTTLQKLWDSGKAPWKIWDK